MTRLVSDLTVGELEALLTRVIRDVPHPSVTVEVRPLDIQSETGLGFRFADELKTKGPDHAPE